MGDRCYMTVTCRRQDIPRFEQLGFTVSDDRGGHVVELEDDSANYAHHGDLPLDIPWTGCNTEGGNYGRADHACDGKTYLECSTDHDGNLTIGWDTQRNAPHPKDIAYVRRFLKLQKRVEEMFARFEQSYEPQQVRAAIAAAEHPFHE